MSGSDVFDKQSYMRALVMSTRGIVEPIPVTPFADWNYYYTNANIIHDYLYWFQPCSREIADHIFKIVMSELNVPAAKILPIYAPVRAAGSSAWADNARQRNAGERRILKDFPTKVSTTWAEWRVNPSVFAD
jgi:hypothetical protein